MELKYTKKELSTGIKRNLFYYKVIDSSYKRGYNKTIEVYVLMSDFSPLFIGECHVNTASYKGDKPTAVNIIASIFQLKTDGYNLINKNIKLYQL